MTTESHINVDPMVGPVDLSRTNWHQRPHVDVVTQSIFLARGRVNCYPDPDARDICAALAERHGIAPEQVTLGNGAGDLLQTAALLLMSSADELITPSPSYPLYPVMARRAGGRAVRVPLTDEAVDLGALRAAVTDRTRLIAICNPNDPTGTRLPAAAVGDLLSGLPDRVYVLVDEALVHFQDDEDEDAILRLAGEFERLLVFRSFSHVFALGGLRGGYVVGAPTAGSLLEALQPVGGVNSLTQAAIEAAITTRPRDAARRRRTVVQQRARVYQALRGLPFTAPASQANFVWLRSDHTSGAELTHALADHGVIVASGELFGDNDHVRATIGEAEPTRALLDALRKVAEPALGRAA